MRGARKGHLFCNIKKGSHCLVNLGTFSKSTHIVCYMPDSNGSDGVATLTTDRGCNSLLCFFHLVGKSQNGRIGMAMGIDKSGGDRESACVYRFFSARNILGYMGNFAVLYCQIGKIRLFPRAIYDFSVFNKNCIFYWFLFIINYCVIDHNIFLYVCIYNMLKCKNKS